MNLLIAALVGFLAGRMLWLAMKGSWVTPSLMRKNFRGIDVPTAAGIVLCLALVVVEALRGVFGAFGMGEGAGFSPIRAAVLAVVLGFGLLGLFDDLAGEASVHGFRGHLKALAKGRLSTGAVKLFGGALLGLVGASFLGAESLGELILDAAVIALAANMGNLFDRRPGRAIKVGLLAFVVPAVLLGLPAELVAPAIVVGAAASILLDDMHEKLMIGDTGANALGAAIGLGIVAATGTSGTGTALVVLVLLTLVGEFISFSKLFDSVGPLRAFDQLGLKRAAKRDSDSEMVNQAKTGGSASRSNDTASSTAEGSTAQHQEAPGFGESQQHQAEWPELLREETPSADPLADSMRKRSGLIDSGSLSNVSHHTATDDLEEDFGRRDVRDQGTTGSGFVGGQLDDSDSEDYALDDSRDLATDDDDIIDLREPESEREMNSASVERGHVGASSGARIHREPRDSSAYRAGDPWTSPRSRGSRKDHLDEFDDLPDFSGRGRASSSQSQDRYRSPFDDKDS